MLITAERIVTGTEVFSPGWLEVTGTVVTALGSGLGAGVPAGTPAYALGAVTVVPGFVDIHTHGGGSGAFPDAVPESSLASRDLHRRHGTTSMIASLVSAHPAELLRQVGVLAEQVQDGLLAGIHLEGPWLSSQRCGAHEPTALRDPEPSEIDRVFAAGKGTVRMVTIAPELHGALPAIRRIVDAGAVAAIGHTDASYEQARAGIAAGARVATHLFNAMRPLHHREPGPITALVEDPRVTIELINDGVHLHPALYRNATKWVGPDRVALITDAMAAAGMSDGAYSLGALDVEVTNGVARVAGTNTIAGSTATMDRVFRNAVLGSGLERAAALRLAVQQASVNPARALGLAAGDLVAGGPADLVVLDKDLQVSGVLHQGAWVAGVQQSRR
ncbi:MAG: N-acetylglucosamine-6-phosphate deacetylase [Micropruina sp.]|uniref:N-acetylglucosamine-6-phosphate deacetylase n=1 Tax=Micropruina sp. TaxID=2737536 RepID=UPI0039E30171